MQSIELGSVVTPPLAAQRGIVLLRERERHGIPIVLYRETRRFSGDVYYITTNHVVVTMTGIERIAVFALLHS